MATYYVWSGAGGTNDGSSWTNAYTTFGSAVTAATTDGDEILVHYQHQDEIAADTVYTFSNNVTVCSVNKDSSNALTAMGTGGWLGNSTTQRSITISGSDKKLFFSGITFRVVGTTSDSINIGGSTGIHVECEDCYFWLENTGTSGAIALTGSDSAYSLYKNCIFRFASVNRSLIALGGRVDIFGGSISSEGAAPSNLFGTACEGTVFGYGFDVSHVTGTIVANISGTFKVVFVCCKLGAGVFPLASQTTNPTKGGSGSIELRDCHSGDTHIFYGYYDALGQVTSDTGIYYTSGAAAQSWKIATTENAGFGTPFVTPWIPIYHSGTSAITPYLEILRDGDDTAYRDNEVWAEFAAKVTSGTVNASFYDDRMTPRGTPANQAAGAGTGSWTDENATAWSGKIDSGTSFTPAEIGYISGRIVVGEPSITVYADPEIRGLA